MGICRRIEANFNRLDIGCLLQTRNTSCRFDPQEAYPRGPWRLDLEKTGTPPSPLINATREVGGGYRNRTDDKSFAGWPDGVLNVSRFSGDYSEGLCFQAIGKFLQTQANLETTRNLKHKWYPRVVSTSPRVTLSFLAAGGACRGSKCQHGAERGAQPRLRSSGCEHGLFCSRFHCARLRSASSPRFPWLGRGDYGPPLGMMLILLKYRL